MERLKAALTVKLKAGSMEVVEGLFDGLLVGCFDLVKLKAYSMEL